MPGKWFHGEATCRWIDQVSSVPVPERGSEVAREGRMKLRMLLCVLCALAAIAPTKPSTLPARVPIGYCASLSELGATRAAGFDYAELRTSEVAALPDAEYEALVARLAHLGFSTPVANLFIPASIRLTGPAINPAQQLTYVRKAFARMARLGVHIIVFGSGGARRYPEGFSKDDAFRQLVDFGRRIGPEARARGITIAIEPLRRQESNIINTAAEGLDLVNAVGDPNIQLMVDFYHLASEHEDPSIIVKAQAHIRHLHMANPTGRVFPLEWEEFSYSTFFEALRGIGYAGRISIEASTTNFPGDAPRSIALLRRAFTQ